MRYLLLTLLWAAPLLAQEGEEPKPAKQDKAAEIRKLLETFLDGNDGKRLEDLEERLRALLQGEDHKFAFKPLTTKEMRVVIAGIPPGGLETISGSSDNTSFTMKSLGGGRYKLTATQKIDDGEAKQITDEGTLKELSKKYDFLKGMVPVGVPYGGFHFPVAGINRVPRARLGMLVRPPSESLSHHLELPTGAGLVVGSVTKGSRADKLGLKEHDVLLRIDGELIDSPDQLGKLEKNKGVLEYLRRAKPHQLDLSKVTASEK